MLRPPVFFKSCLLLNGPFALELRKDILSLSLLLAHGKGNQIESDFPFPYHQPAYYYPAGL